MARIGRGVPQQSFSYAGKALGPRSPSAVSIPLAVTTLSVNLATGVLTNQRRGQQRFPAQGFIPGSPTSAFTVTSTDDEFATAAGTVQLFGITSQEALGMSFVAASAQMAYVDVELRLGGGAPLDSVTLSIYSDTGGGLPNVSVAVSPTLVPGQVLTNNAHLYRFSIPASLALVPGATYWVVLGRTGALDNSNAFGWTRTTAVITRPAFFVSGSWITVNTPGQRFLVAYGTWSDPIVLITRRGVGLASPVVVSPPTQPRPTLVVMSHVAVGASQRPRGRVCRLGAPVVLAKNPPVVTTINTKLVAARPRPTWRVLRPPNALRVFAGPTTPLIHIRPRRTTASLGKPTVVRVPSVEQQEQTIRTPFVQTRPRSRAVHLGSPVVISRPTFGPPIFTKTVQARPRHLLSRLSPPIFAASGFVAPTIQTTFAENRDHGLGRRHFPSSVLYSPAVLSVFSGPSVSKIVIRPRPTRFLLARPTVVRVPQVEQQEDTIRTTLVRARPRLTISRVEAPTVIRVPSVEQQEQTVRTSLAHTRPRATEKFIFPPVTAPRAVILVPLRIALVQTRPRHATRYLFAPTVTQVFAEGQPHFVRIRPRPTTKVLGKPTVIRTPSVEQAEQTIRTSLARIRPRPTVKSLAKPNVLQVFAEGTTKFVLARPRPTTHRLFSPTVIRIPSIEQQEDTIKSTLVRTRPRPTSKHLSPPAALRGFAGPSITLVHTRPRSTSKKLSAPTVVRIEVHARPVVTPLVQTRPRATTTILVPPTVFFPLPTLLVQTIKVVLAKIRPRKTATKISPPTVLSTAAPPTLEQQTLSIALVSLRSRVEQVRHTPHSFLRGPQAVIPLPGLRVQTIQTKLVQKKPRHTISVLAGPATLRFDRLKSQSSLTRTRPRSTTYKLAGPTVLRTFTGPLVRLALIRPAKTSSRLRLVLVAPVHELTIRVSLVQARPRKAGSHLPLNLVRSVSQAQQTITSTRVLARPRATTSFLAPPAIIRAAKAFPFGPISLTQTRPPKTTYKLAAPVVVDIPSVRQAQETIKAILVQARPRPTVQVLGPPHVVAEVTRAVATTGASHPKIAETSVTESAEATASSSRTDTIAETSPGEQAEARVSASERAEAETEAN